jgi:hypothetical protein
MTRSMIRRSPLTAMAGMTSVAMVGLFAYVIASPARAATAADTAAASAGSAAWTSANTPTMPPSGQDQSEVADPATGQLLAYDDYLACSTPPEPTETWTWDGAGWTSHVQVAPPHPRSSSALGYDQASRQVVMFGGFVSCGVPASQAGLVNETWTWNGSIWTQQHPATSPSARYGACAAGDAATGQFIVYGGQGNIAYQPVNLSDTWNWTGSTWQPLSPSTTPPAGYCAMTYDASAKVIVMLVATSGDSAMQTWLWNGSDWTRAADVPVVGEANVSYDPDTGTDLTYIGDTDCTSLAPSHGMKCVQTDQLWSWDGASWTQLPATNAPEAGHDYAASYDAATHQYVVLGGPVWRSDGTMGGSEGITYVYAATGSSTATPVRVAGANRQATAVAASETAFPTDGSASAVVLARADLFADALAGGPLAAAKDGPLLLTSSGSLDDVTKAEIARVLPTGGTVYLLGGTSALSDAVATAISAFGDTPTRIAGTDRFATAVAVADALGDPTTVFEASGTNFPDALSAVPAAVAERAAILLTNGSTPDPATDLYLADHTTTRYAVGGPAAWADPTATAIAGPDRYATSEAVALAFFANAAGVAVASGTAFPDALAAGPLAGASGQPVLLVPSAGTLPEPVVAYLSTRAEALTSVRAFGGSTAVTDTVLSEIGSALRP